MGVLSVVRSVSLGFVLCLSARIAVAEEVDDASRSAARTLGYAGVEAYQAGDYAAASGKLEKAYTVLQAPSLGLWSARALAKRGKLIEAAERYRQVMRLEVKGGEAAVQKEAQADASKELDELTPRVPSVVIQVEGATATEVSVTIDGAKVASALIGEARPVNPGRHLLEGVKGSERVKEEITLAEGDKKPVVLRFANGEAATSSAAASPASPGGAAPASQDRPAASGPMTRTLGWVAIGLGGAGLVVGGVTAGLAVSKKGALETNALCDSELRCLRSEQSDVESYNSMRTISGIGFIAGGVLAATGVVLVLTSPTKSEPETALWLGPNSAGFRRTF